MEGWIPNSVVAAEAVTTLGKVEIPETDEMSTSADSHESDPELAYLLERVTNNLNQRKTADQELLERAGRILEETRQQSDSKHVKTETEIVEITQTAAVDTDSEDLQDAELQYPDSSIQEYAYNWSHPPDDQVAPVPRNSPESLWGPNQSSYVPRVGITTSPAFAKLLKEKMRMDYNQGYPKGVKYVSVLLNKHLTQLEDDLDKTWRTTRECTALIQDEIALRVNPRRMGNLFKLHETRPLVRDLEEVMELVIGRITLEAAICNDHGTVDYIDNNLRQAWGHLHHFLHLSLEHLTIPRKERPLEFYHIFQTFVYEKLREFDPETMEELQVAMEMYRADQDVLFADETWPVERKERFWR